MLCVASTSTGHLCWEGGGVQAEDPVSGANDGHVTADALQMSVQPRQLRRHQLLHGVTTAGFRNHIQESIHKGPLQRATILLLPPIADNNPPRRGTPTNTDQSI